MPPKGRPRPKPVLEQKPFIRLYLAAATHYPDYPGVRGFRYRTQRSCGSREMNEAYEAVRRVLPTFEPLEVMPHLTRFMRGPVRRGQAAWEVFLNISSSDRSRAFEPQRRQEQSR